MTFAFIKGGLPPISSLAVSLFIACFPSLSIAQKPWPAAGDTNKIQLPDYKINSNQVITSDQLPTVPSNALDQALVGKIAGGLLSSGTGTPGASVNISLRGVNSFSNATLPLVLLDGVQIDATQLNELDPSVVDHVEIVSGAASGAIYGYQGANGAMLITTKKGSAGKLKIDVYATIGTNSFLNNGNVHKASLHNLQTDASGYLTDANKKVIALNSDNLTYSGDIVYNPFDPEGKATKSYLGMVSSQDLFLKPSVTSTTAFKISGGGKKIDVLFSFSNSKVRNSFVDDGFNSRTNFVFNLGYTPIRNLTLRTVTQLALNENTVNYFESDAFMGLISTRPFADYWQRDSENNYGFYYGNAAGTNGYNPNYYFQYTNRFSQNNNVFQSLHASYKLNHFLEINADYGINMRHLNEKINILDQSDNNNVKATGYYLSNYNPFDEKGEKMKNYTRYIPRNATLSAVFKVDFKKDLHFSIPIRSTTLPRVEWRRTDFNVQSDGYSYTTKQLGFIKAKSLLFQQVFEINNWLGIEGALRRDRLYSISNIDNRSYTFRQAGAYLLFSDLSFWRNTAFLKSFSVFKVRAQVGKAGIATQLVPSSTTASNGYYTGFLASNYTYSQETSLEKEIGVDIAVISNEKRWFSGVDFSITNWRKKTPTAYVSTNLANVSGLGLYTSRVAFASNGWQLSLKSTIYHSRKLDWIFASYFGSQSLKMDNGYQIQSGDYVLIQGNNPIQMYGSRFLSRVDQKDENGVFFIPVSQQQDYSIASNGYVVKNSTKQPVPMPNRFDPLGSVLPKFNLSFINTLVINRLVTFSFQWDGVFKQHLYNETKQWMYRDGIHGDYEKQITINNETGAWTAFYRGAYQLRQVNSYFVENASFLRLRNVSIKINLLHYIKGNGFRSLQLELSGRNLITLTKYTGMDPEINSGASQSSWDRGTDNATLPNVKSYQAGLYLGF